MKLDPNKPIECKAASDAEIVGPIGSYRYLVYSKRCKDSWNVDLEGDPTARMKYFSIRNVPEKTAEHWIAHYLSCLSSVSYTDFADCQNEYSGASWYTHHWLEDGEPKCEAVKIEKGK